MNKLSIIYDRYNKATCEVTAVQVTTESIQDAYIRANLYIEKALEENEFKDKSINHIWFKNEDDGTKCLIYDYQKDMQARYLLDKVWKDLNSNGNWSKNEFCFQHFAGVFSEMQKLYDDLTKITRNFYGNMDWKLRRKLGVTTKKLQFLSEDIDLFDNFASFKKARDFYLEATDYGKHWFKYKDLARMNELDKSVCDSLIRGCRFLDNRVWASNEGHSFEAPDTEDSGMGM